MAYNPNRKRPIQVKFFVDENELAAIRRRMADFCTDNFSAYLRTMAPDGIFPPAYQKSLPGRKRAGNSAAQRRKGARSAPAGR